MLPNAIAWRPINLKINMPIYPKPALDKRRLHQSCFWHDFEKASLPEAYELKKINFVGQLKATLLKLVESPSWNSPYALYSIFLGFSLTKSLILSLSISCLSTNRSDL